MYKSAKVILNEQHKLKDEQTRILDERFGDNWEIVPVPREGWTLVEQRAVAANMMNAPVVVFASPVPVLLAVLAREHDDVAVFHNDNRVKKELPNGRIISVIADEGWQLVYI